MKNIELLKKQGVDIEGAINIWGDIDTYNENLVEFKDSLATRLTDLEKFLDAQDYSNYAIVAHSLKSESKYFGFMREADIFYQHELKGKENDGAYIKSHFDEIKKTIEDLLYLIKEYLSDDGEVKNILAVDDSNIVLNFIEHNLSSDYKLLKATDGNEALNKLANNLIYALFLDLNMPKTNGFDVLAYLKEHNLIEKIPVIIITGDDTPETIEKAFSYPILDVLNKPFTDDNIKRIINSIENFYERQK